MLTHFQWKPLYKQASLPGWRITFYFNGSHYDAIYHKSGLIEWGTIAPPKDDEELVISQIQELMLFHVYE